MIDWDDYAKFKISPEIHSNLRHADIASQLQSLQEKHSDRVKLRPLGNSVEGRSISLLSLGTGNKRVLAWTQMHGDEPTHTAAVLDVIQFLLSDSQHPIAKAIVENCELHFLLMLNPDGAERWTRRNVQDIDINRDALHVQTPEGKILRDTVLELQPDFALNLHNQRPRTTVAGTQHPASFALLVPPIDAEESDTENVLAAKRLAGLIAEAVAPHSPGPVSRYDADYMPRCFGEWVQQQGAATITIEAGGWSTVDAEPLVQLHFFGLVACLEAVATGGFEGISPEIYESLPRTGEHDLFDVLLRGATLISGQDPPLCADLGINFRQTAPTIRDGRIVDLGDLCVSGGKQTTDASNLVCLPGRFAWLPEISPIKLPDESQIRALLERGVTTVLGLIDLTSNDVESLEDLRREYSSALNLGFLAKLPDSSSTSLEQLTRILAAGAIGVFDKGLSAEVRQCLTLLNCPIVTATELPTLTDEEISLAECAAEAQRCANLLALEDYGTVKRGATADLMLLRCGSEHGETTTIEAGDLQQVLVAGNVVFEHNQVNHLAPGVLLSGFASKC